MNSNRLSARAYDRISDASSWEEIWEAGPYYDRIADLLEDAKRYVILVGWQIDSRLRLKKPFRPSGTLPIVLRETLREKIIRICNEKPDFQVYLLVWDHAYFYMLEREIWQGRIWEDIHPRVHFVFDNRHPFGGSHHEKICLIDGRIALCGGIDLCDERWDTPQHLYSDCRRSLDWSREHHGPYHDLAVQVTGAVCAGIQDHIAKRWRALSSIPFPDSYPFQDSIRHGAGHKIYLSRTFAPIDRNPLEGPFVREVEFLFRDLIQMAEKRIIIEGQYYWSQSINDMLISKVHQMRGTDFEIYIILAELQPIRSWTRFMMAYELSLLRKLGDAANSAGIKLVAGSPYVLAPSPGFSLPPRPIYIHSKIMVIDDTHLGIGSANFASRALRVDTETQMTFEAISKFERNHIEKVALKILHHWNINYSNPESNIIFRTFKPMIELEHLRTGLMRTRKVPWQKLFDPPVPWFYPLKWVWLRITRRHHSISLYGMILLWGLGVGLAWRLAGISEHWNDWSTLYIALLSSVWLLPVPFILTLLLAAIHLGPDDASRISVTSLWVASFLGYSLIRIFPTTLSQIYRESVPAWLSVRMRRRSFPSLLSILADPRVSIRSKIAYQGLYCIPVPWFALGTDIILAAILYLFPYWFAGLIQLLIPIKVLEFIKLNACFIVSVIAAASVEKVVVTYGKATNKSHLL